MKETILQLIEQNKLILKKLDSMEKQINDLHTIVMSAPAPKKKGVTIKKLTQKDKLNSILGKRAFNSVTKSN